MSDPIAPTTTEPAAPAAPAEEEWKARPEWEEALAVVPDGLRGNLYKQIRTSEAEAQKAVEAARQGSVEPQWREFTDLAKGAGVDPATLIESYNIRQAMLQDPQKFYNDLKREIDAAVATGALTPAEGAAATAQAQQQASDATDLKTPEQERMDALEARLGQMTEAQQAQYQAQVEAQQNQAATAYYDEFTRTVEKTFTDAGYGAASPETKIAVMRMADSALNGDITDTLTLQQAVGGAFNALLKFRDTQAGAPAAAAAAQAGQVPPPVGGGRGVAAPAPQKFTDNLDGKKARIEAMLEEGRRQTAAGITE